jgi:hypothetical protein
MTYSEQRFGEGTFVFSARNLKSGVEEVLKFFGKHPGWCGAVQDLTIDERAKVFDYIVEDLITGEATEAALEEGMKLDDRFGF